MSEDTASQSRRTSPLMAVAVYRLVVCSFCGYEMDEYLGKYGCPNCHGEGLEKKMKSSYLFYCVTQIKGLLYQRNENKPTPKGPNGNTSGFRRTVRVWSVIRVNKATVSIRHENGLTGRDCLYLNRFLDIKTGKVVK